jgi:acyl-CoA hydrolase
VIIKNCAHPEFQDQLWQYLEYVKQGHTPQSLSLAFAMHRQYDRTGDMRGINWAEWRR